MAVLTITVDNAQVQRIYTAFAATYGTTGTGSNLPAGHPTPTTALAGAFIKTQIITFTKNVVKGYEGPRDAETARAAAVVSVDTNITPT